MLQMQSPLVILVTLIASATCVTRNNVNHTCLESRPTGSSSPNGFNGVLFDIQVGAEDIMLRNFLTQVSSAWNGQRPASLYLTSNGDSYANNLNSLDDWTKVADALIGPATENSFVSFDLKLDHRLESGALQGVYIDLDDTLNIRYYNGAYEGQPIGTDAHVQLRGGRGVGHTFRSQFAPRQFSGTVCYDVDVAQVCPRDENLEVLLPPQLDEANTRLVLDDTKSAEMKVTVVVSEQYDSAKISFSGAADDSGSFDSKLMSNVYWTVDNATDPCNSIYIGRIPWALFRSSLGGVTEERYSQTVYYTTGIEIEVTKPITLDPENLLLLQADVNQGGRIVETNGSEIADFYHGDFPEGSTIPPYVPEATSNAPLDLLQAPHAQQYTRTVHTRIPFEVAFDLNVQLSASVVVPSNSLGVTANVVGTSTSILAVEPNESHFAEAQLEIETTVPLPFYLKKMTIEDTGPNEDLGEIVEISTKRRCDAHLDFCTQYWRVNVNPQQCALSGLSSTLAYAACHESAGDCAEPSPATAIIEIDVTSDDFCGATQKVFTVGCLALSPANCNQHIHGRVTVSNAGGAAISRTEIVLVRAEPALLNSSFLTVFDAASGISILDYSRVLQAHQIEFSFKWDGDKLRCGGEARVEVFVHVEFATASSLTSRVASPGTKLLSMEQSVHMAASVSILSDSSSRQSASSGSGPGDGSGGGESSSAGAGSDGTGSSGGGSGSAIVGVVAALFVVLVALVAGGVHVWRRKKLSRSPKPKPSTAPMPMLLTPVSRWTKVPMTFIDSYDAHLEDEEINGERHSLSRVQAAMESVKLKGSRKPRAPTPLKCRLQTL